MNKKEVYEELEKDWDLFSMSDESVKNIYCGISGLDIEEHQTIIDLKEYLLSFALEQIIHDGDLSITLATEIEGEILEKWK